MQTAVALYLVLLSGIVCIIMMRDHIRGRTELLSVRNFALLGFIVFQLTSAAIPLFKPFVSRFPLTDVEGVALSYAARCTLFLICLFLFYRWGLIVRKAARSIPTTTAIPSEAFMLIVAVILMMMALTLRALVKVPLVGVLADYVGVAFASIACGIAGWTWAKRFLNPVAAAYAIMIFLGSSASVIFGSFGRRSLLAVGCGMLWGMYYSRWRYSNPTRMITQMIVAAAIPTIALALYTSARSSREHDRGVLQHVQAIAREGNVLDGFALLLDGQGTGATSMWLVENYPDTYPYRWFHTPKYFLVFPIPRAVWEGKPDALSQRLAEDGNIQGVDRSRLKIGPGIIGHAAAEGGWIATLFYGALMGLFLRFFDELVAKSPVSPFAVLPVGAALGQIIGLSRGETAPFAFNYVFGVLGSYVTLIIVSRVVIRIGLARPSDAATNADHHDPGAHPNEHADHYAGEYDNEYADAYADGYDQTQDDHDHRRHAG